MTALEPSPRCRVHRLVADVAILVDHSVPLVRYRDVRRYDGQRGWFLPDDELAHGEHPADAAIRIAREQLGIELGSVRVAHIESFGGERSAWHLAFHCVATPTDKPAILPGENVAAAEWFPLSALPPAGEVARDGWALDILATIQAEVGVLG
jgi:ADP-ribose pyrophosphatase YjhB (NUDIX family)